MLIFRETKFIKSPFQSEAELEAVVVKNYEYLFGPNSLYLPKAKTSLSLLFLLSYGMSTRYRESFSFYLVHSLLHQ